MKSKITLLVAILVTSLGFSQNNPNNTYMSSFVYKAKDGMISKFEAAAEKKTKMFNKDRSEELKYWDKNVAPYADALVGQQRWMWEEWATIGDQPEPPRYLHKTILRYKPGMEEHVSRFIYRTGKVLEKRNPEAFRRVFSPVSGGDMNMFVIFSGFNEYGREWSNTDNTWEEDYNEMFGWEQFSDDLKMSDKSLREWNGRTRTTLERMYF